MNGTLTYQDYAALEEGAPVQLIHGELIVSPAPSVYHQMIVWKLGTAMRAFVDERSLGLVLGAPVDVSFSDSETYQPDLIFISSGRQAILTPERIVGAPDLVVEVLSPATSRLDVGHKKDVYEASGVLEYWLVDPQQLTVEVYAHKEGYFESSRVLTGSNSAKSSVLSGFEMELKDLFTR